jgi:hypothetical protein
LPARAVAAARLPAAPFLANLSILSIPARHRSTSARRCSGNSALPQGHGSGRSAQMSDEIEVLEDEINQICGEVEGKMT